LGSCRSGGGGRFTGSDGGERSRAKRRWGRSRSLRQSGLCLLELYYLLLERMGGRLVFQEDGKWGSVEDVALLGYKQLTKVDELALVSLANGQVGVEIAS
jgi:hypothetical protein